MSDNGPHKGTKIELIDLKIDFDQGKVDEY